MTIVVAEISANHSGFLQKAQDLVRAAADCGCQYAKFQYYTASEMWTNDKETLNTYTRLCVPLLWLDVLFTTARESGIGLFASVFSVDGVRDLLPYSPPFFKLASPQSTWLPPGVVKDIVRAIPRARTQVIMSCDNRDLDRVIEHEADYILYCPPGHPYYASNPDFFEYADEAYDGLSDHTPGLLVPLAFAQAGARMIEKHLKLDDDCIDARFSADRRTMKHLCALLT